MRSRYDLHVTLLLVLLLVTVPRLPFIYSFTALPLFDYLPGILRRYDYRTWYSVRFRFDLFTVVRCHSAVHVVAFVVGCPRSLPVTFTSCYLTTTTLLVPPVDYHTIPAVPPRLRYVTVCYVGRALHSHSGVTVHGAVINLPFHIDLIADLHVGYVVTHRYCYAHTLHRTTHIRAALCGYL